MYEQSDAYALIHYILALKFGLVIFKSVLFRPHKIVRSVAYQVIKRTIVFCFVGYYKSLADLAKDNLTSSPSTKADVLVLHHDDLNTDHFGDPSPRGHECIAQQPSEIDLQVSGIDLLIHLVRINAASSKKSDGLRLGMRI